LFSSGLAMLAEVASTHSCCCVHKNRDCLNAWLLL